MITNLQRIFNFHIKSNIRYYILIICGFMCGGIIAAACVFGLSDLDFKELSVYFEDFFQSVKGSGFDSFEIFRLSAWENLKLFFAISIVSMMITGAVFIPFFSAICGYSFCFTTFYILKAYSFKGVALLFSIIFPHQLILLPCLMLTFCVSMNFSATITIEKGGLKAKLLKYFLKILILYLVSVLASLLQGYIEPLLIKLVLPLFVK